MPKDGCASLYSQVMIDDSSVMYVPSTLSVYSSSSLRHDSYARNSHALRNRRHAQSRPTGLGLAWLGLAWLGLAWLGLAWQHGKPRKQQRDVVGLCATPTVGGSRTFHVTSKYGTACRHGVAAAPARVSHGHRVYMPAAPSPNQCSVRSAVLSTCGRLCTAHTTRV